VTVEEPAVTPPSPPIISDADFFQTRVQDIFFDFDKYDIRSDQQATADNDARSLAERSNLKFTIEGHCDERGSEKYNLALGDRRANAAKAYLVAHGVSTDRIDTISYGKERPFDPGHNEEAWAKNRRAHLVLR
jgi:peptidoglycan-associated lipoprotein